uniref:Xanthine dehydrogenase family protein molybdopterin-binding subunit n=1 Tax=Roseihalotalea indica TaxID=2867963 RepID=A0AA49GPZ1_9BACT|nr:xanthine dehydrogenase family protein molybdopterin-binding subunit [Tunicatimonas sp. TK19036]
MIKTDYIGKPSSRVDGRKKVTGQAKYAGEFYAEDLTYGYVISSSIAKGTITSMDTSEALALPGVLQVFTHENGPRVSRFDGSYQDQTAPPGSPFRPLYSNEVQYNMQPVGLVVAETFEVARYAASLVKVEYKQESHTTNPQDNFHNAYLPKEGRTGFDPPPKPRGDAEEAFASAPIKVDGEYIQSAEHHNPMEPHASTVIWEGDGKLTIYDKTQSAANSQQYVCDIFGLPQEDVRVFCPFIGGAFGSGLRPQYQLFLAVMASISLKRSVRVTLTRQQMFTFGHRPATYQKLKLGADEQGNLLSVQHNVLGETSTFESYIETVANWSGLLYQCDNVKLGYQIVPVDMYTPMDMRAPGGVTGVYALECAVDELAHAAGVDPLEFRLKNYAEIDQNMKKPFTSKELRQCYQQGAERFGWSKRNPEPRSTRKGHDLIGWGMATGVWEAAQMPASAKALLSVDGKLTVSSSTADIGTGTYTIMTQIAAETLGLPLEDVSFKLGDTSLPQAPIEGGSWTASSVGSAVKAVCQKIGQILFKLAKKIDKSPFADASFEDIRFENGYLIHKENLERRASITDILRNAGKNFLEETISTKPSKEQDKYTSYTHSAVFVEVQVDEDLGTVKVSRVVSAIAGGRILNPKTAESQILGATVWGIGMALEEHSVVDHYFGRIMNHNLAEYHVAVNADIHDIDVIFVEEHDDIINPLGAKGLGEIGIVGVASAISNAIFHATGKRIRELPITMDKLL